MLIERSREKLLNALIFFSGGVLHPGKTKLFKLLNYLDFLHYQKTGRSVTELKYEAWEKGPVPVDLFNELKNPNKDFINHLVKTKEKFKDGRTRQRLKARKQFDGSWFSPFELELMEMLAKKHFSHTAEQMSEDSHFETGPWHEVYIVRKNKGGEMPYDLVLLRRGSKEDMEILDKATEYKEIQKNYA